MTEKQMTSEEFDEYFDNGGDTTPYIIPGTVRRPNLEKSAQRVNFTIPLWLLDELDAQARHLAISRQAVAVTWLADRAKQERLSA